MRSVWPVALVAAVALWAAVACDGDDGGPSTTPTTIASPVATATAGPTSEPTEVAGCPPATESDGMEGFRAFVACIAGALAAGGGTVLTDRAVEEEITCDGTEELGPCVGKAAGTVLRGIRGAIAFPGLRGDMAGPDAFSLFPPNKYAAMFTRWAADARPDVSDEKYGDGRVVLYALAHRPAIGESEEAYHVILAAITGPFAPLRQARVLDFRFQDGLWRFTGELFANIPFTADLFLSGECADCYDSWERYP